MINVTLPGITLAVGALLLLILFFVVFKIGQKRGWDEGVVVGEKHGYANGQHDAKEGHRDHAPH